MFINKVVAMKNLIDYNETDLNKKILAKNADDMAILFALKKNQLLPTHISPVEAFIFVLEGEVLFNIDNINHTITAGESLFFQKNEKHTVLAQKDSKFLVVRLGQQQTK